MAAPRFTAVDVRAEVRRLSSDSSPGPSALRYSYLQQCLGAAGVGDCLAHLLAWLGTQAYAAPDSLPPEFWELHSSARLFAVGGKKVRPIACGDSLRRLFGRMFCHQAATKERVAGLLESAGQFGVGARGGSERVALMAQVVHESGGVLVAVDGTNAFNTLSRSAMLGAVANFMPQLLPCVLALYGPGRKPALQYGLERQPLATLLQSQQGVQQGDPLGPRFCLR